MDDMAEKEYQNSSKRAKQEHSSTDLHEADKSMEVNQPIEPSASSEIVNEIDTEIGQHLINFEEGEEQEDVIETQSSDSTDASNVELENLSLNALLTMAKLKYQREKVLELVFAEKYGNDWLHLNASSALEMEKWIKAIRFFGHTIKKLSIDYHGIDLEDCIELDRCLYSHCADTLVELKIRSAPRYGMNHMTKPCSKVESITFIDLSLIHI